MEEAAGADYVAIIDNGIISASGTPSMLRTKHSRDTLKFITPDIDKLKDFLSRQGVEFSISGGSVIVRIPKTIDAIPLINKAQKLISGFEVISGSMDDAFVNITGHTIREDGN
jgi:multidrug/hemolysin transport system ATP-binding protein